MKTNKTFFALLILLFISYSCEKETEKTAPELPPESAFVIDFSDFSSNDTITNKDNMTYINWGHSYFNVTVWNGIITLSMAIPIASFVESFNHEAIYHPSENNWTWSYNFNASGIHEAELTGYIENDSAVWEMRIDNFLWYYGRSQINATGGYWILNESKNQPNKLLEITWNRYSENEADIKYTNVKEGAAENGGYISYGKTTNDLNRFYNIYNKGANNLTEIEWNSTDKHGHVKDIKRFGDELWHCWDSTLVDIACN
ncbi:MAG: hypothetical protein GXO79_00625 [Chlorobi bacterium]|nr:hypothetical protein [Chlorobiota bacterium]